MRNPVGRIDGKLINECSLYDCGYRWRDKDIHDKIGDRLEQACTV